MLLDGVLDLRAPNLFPHAADLLAQPERAAIVKAHEFIPRLGIDLGDHKAVSIIGAFVGERI